MSWARPTERAVVPAPLATISQPARTAWPQRSPAVTSSDRLWRFFALLRGAAGRAGRTLPRGAAFDLLVRLPDRAAVLLGMTASLIANAPSAP
ncbi:hypothetical protein MNVI_33760 [Mycobacterium noviomagense]|uniref:Uncharacterized protein n=1 Tax=Mycobacterium noviomagense TaxID=459858 RepID=A0A7I7PHF1_9MYCO|nr:hypothetical protein MNVI_33760 [Mycobacterium noviomagense]